MELILNHQKKYSTNKTDVYHIDDIWSLDKLDLESVPSENNRKHRYVSIVIDNFSNFGRTLALKNKNSQTKKILLKSFFITSKRSPTLNEADTGKRFY